MTGMSPSQANSPAGDLPTTAPPPPSRDDDIERLKAAMNASLRDRAELAALVRVVQGNVGLPGSLPFSSDETKLVVDAAIAVLEPALAELLSQQLMTDVAPLLVCGRALDLNGAARALAAGELKGTLKENVLALLTSKLETRGAIVETGFIADSSNRLETLCRECPTKRALQQCKWEQVEALLKTANGDLASETERNAVWTVWSVGHDLRQKVKSFALSPEVADHIVDKGFQSMKVMKETELAEIQYGQSDGVKAKLRRMWARESEDGQAENETARKKRETLQAKAKEAAALVTKLKSDVSAARTSTDSETSQALNTALASLGLSTWTSSVARVQDPSQMVDSLTQLGNVLERTEAALVHKTGDDASDENVISQASAGLALYAVSFGYSANDLGKKALRPLLRIPEFCPLQSPSMSATSKSSVHSSIESANNYRASINSCGESIAATLKASGWGFHADASYSTSKQELSKAKTETARRSTTAVSVTYGVVPVKSFRISQQHMKLSSEAESAALAVTTLTEARCFLEDFGSHVPCDTQHLGGIFWKIVQIRTEDECESHELESALAKETGTSLGFGGGGWGIDVTAAGETGRSSSSETATGSIDQKRSYTATTRIECTGPNVSNYDLFSQVLAANNTSWFLIDRGSSKALVPVWDLLSKCQALKRAEKLLRTAWIDNAQDLSHLPDVAHLLYRAHIRERFPSKPLECGLLSDKEQSKHQVSQKIGELRSIPLDDADAQVIVKAVECAFSVMFHFDYRFDTFVVAEYMRSGVLPEFLSDLVSRAATLNVLPTVRYLCDVLDTPMKVKLLEADPPVELDEQLEKVLAGIRSRDLVPLAETELQIWQAPVVSLSKLPSTVKTIADAVVQSAPDDSALLSKRVGSVLSLNLWRTSEKSSMRNKLLEVATNFYCGRDGFSFPLTASSLMALIAELERVVEPPSVIEVALPLDVPRFEFDTDARASNGLPYSYVRVDRRTPDRTQDLPSSILHVLMHRLDIQSSLYPSSRQSTATDESARRASRSGRAAKFRQAVPEAAITKPPSVFDATVRLLLSLDASARSEVIRLLLETRFMVPFILPTSSTKENTPFHCDLTSLGLVSTAVGHDGEDIVRANLATDTTHMRVAVLSNRTKEESTSKDWIETVFHIQSFHALDCKTKVELTKAETAAEIGWGFLKKDDGDYVPLVLLHVVGDYRPLRHFIAMFADAVVLDAGSSAGTSSCDIKLHRGALVKWSLADPDQESSVESNENDPVFVESLRCRYTESVTSISSSLLDEFEESRGRKRVPLDRMQSSEVHVAQAPRFNFGAMNDKTSFATLRSELQLQLVFAQESREVIASQRESNPMELASQKNTIATYQYLRQSLAPEIDCHDVIKLFKDILGIESASSRCITLLDLERWLTNQCEEQSVSARKAYREARNVWHDDNSKANSENLAEKLSNWDMKTITMEHLWRELSHLYVVDPKNRSNLASFAAQHLLDGFSLELMDGDAGMMNLKWIQGVLKELHQKLGSARLLVLSVMGVQSSGKSTLLNYMFGVRLRASVSRCTRGVSIQLLKCEGRDEYEYVLLMDTEGIRAPEYIGTEDSVWRDNRMATFAILPADATIILTKGESTTTINEILPIVLSAYLGSETAQEHGGQLPSKLLFVFNQIDVAEKSKLENVVDTLMRELNENARKVEEIRRGQHLQESGRREPLRPTGVFNNLNMDIADEEGSDVRVLGTVKAESHPPRDAPLSDYGSRLLKLREHIHRRVCVAQSWNGRTVKDFSECITRVWKCIESSNFHFNFIAAFERINYDILVHRVDQCEQGLTKKYSTAFDAISKAIREATDNGCNDSVDGKALSDRFGNRLTADMMSHLENLDAEVAIIMKEERFSKWSTDQLSRWTRYKTDQASHWRRLLDGLVDNIFRYESIVEGYKKELRDKANRMFRNGGFQPTLFNNLFDELVHKANEKHPPFHKKVAGLVDQVFARNQDLPLVKKRMKMSEYIATALSWVYDAISPSQKSKLEELWRSIERDVKQTLAGETQYSDGIVAKCIQLTKLALVDAESQMKVSDEMKKLAFTIVKNLICTDLTAIQCQWDRENSVAARFETCRPQMESYFNNLNKGWRGMDLLTVEICNWLSRNMQRGFEEELVAIVGAKLKGERWVESADVMQALVDNSLVQHLERNQVNTALRKISNPGRHIEDVVSQQIAQEVKRCSTEKRDAFKVELKRSISAAARKAEGAMKDRAMVFLTTLKSQIREYLHTGATNCLLTTMPGASDPNFNCDHQSADVFDPENKYFVCFAMLDVVELMKTQSVGLDIKKELLVDVIRDVLAYIKDRAHGASRGVMPRCGVLCPICKSPCTRELGHVANEEEKRHDSYHQPIGLVGCRNENTNELVPGSCSFNAKNAWSFKHSDGNRHKFSEFDKVFPNWSLPVEKKPLLLREHIFYNYQEELASFHSLKKCTELPLSYNHLMSDIKENISELLS